MASDQFVQGPSSARVNFSVSASLAAFCLTVAKATCPLYSITSSSLPASPTSKAAPLDDNFALNKQSQAPKRQQQSQLHDAH
ncbi:hypothetical protein TYRP_012713 [Tyrophagus putrescentiae]|nr:hypothetical protein TYRP_012713 [Tyrophagus putrescentiae]